MLTPTRNGFDSDGQRTAIYRFEIEIDDSDWSHPEKNFFGRAILIECEITVPIVKEGAREVERHESARVDIIGSAEFWIDQDGGDHDAGEYDGPDAEELCLNHFFKHVTKPEQKRRVK